MRHIIDKLGLKYLEPVAEDIFNEVYKENYPRLESQIDSLRNPQDSDMGTIFREIERIAILRLKVEIASCLEKMPVHVTSRDLSKNFDNLLVNWIEYFLENTDFESILQSHYGEMIRNKCAELAAAGLIDENEDFITVPRK